VRADLEGRGLTVFEASSISHEGLKELSFAMAAIVAASRTIVPIVPRVVIQPRAIDDSGFTVRRERTADGERYRVRGAKPERWVRQTDFANDEAVGYLADRLARLGVEEKLVKAGAIAGDEVVIGGDDAVVFDWEPTVLAGGAPAAPRGSDVRFDESSRPTRAAKREQLEARQAGRHEVQAELAAERKANLWTDPALDDVETGEQAQAGEGETGR
jgi:GTPase